MRKHGVTLRPMTYLRTLLIPLIAMLGACGDKSTDEATDAGTTGGADTSSTAPTTTTDDSSGGAPTSTGADTTTGSTTTNSTTTNSTTGDSTTSNSTTSDSTTNDSTTAAPLCSLEQAATDLAASNGEFEDCGTVTPWDDDTAAWQAAHDCAIAATKEQRAFKVITWLQGIDSDVGEAYASILGRSYGVTRFHFDSDPCGGGGCGPVLSASTCDGLIPVANCTVEPGNACLTCVDAGEFAQVCGPE